MYMFQSLYILTDQSIHLFVSVHQFVYRILTLVLLNLDMPCLYSVDPDQLVCLCWGFTAQSTQGDHVEHCQFTYPHAYWAGLVLLVVNQYCAHSIARNWHLSFWNQWKGENDCRNYFMINLHERMLPTSAGIEPATSWSPVGRRIQMSHRGRPRSVGFFRSWLIWIYTVCHLVCDFVSITSKKINLWTSTFILECILCQNWFHSMKLTKVGTYEVGSLQVSQHLASLYIFIFASLSRLYLWFICCPKWLMNELQDLHVDWMNVFSYTKTEGRVWIL